MTTDNLIRAENFERDTMLVVQETIYERDISVRRLAADIGVHHNTLHTWLRGAASPPLGALATLAYALDMTMEGLINGG